MAAWFSAISDAVHKIVSPSTYPCALCAVTYGAMAMRREWRAFLDSLPMAKRFHHRDDFARAWPGLAVALPAILVQRGNAAPEMLLDAAALDRIDTLPALIEAVRRRLDLAGIGRPGRAEGFEPAEKPY